MDHMNGDEILTTHDLATQLLALSNVPVWIYLSGYKLMPVKAVMELNKDDLVGRKDQVVVLGPSLDGMG